MINTMAVPLGYVEAGKFQRSASEGPLECASAIPALLGVCSGRREPREPGAPQLSREYSK